MIEELRKSGLVRLGCVSWVGEFVDYLAGCEKYPGHVRARPRAGISCNSMQDVMAAPHFLQYAKSFTPLASEYFGETATLWSLNAFYTDEKTPFIPSINGLHRDQEADKILCLFVLGTDTPIWGSQLFAKDPSWSRLVFGARGTAWLVDTTYPHCGFLGREPRTLAWARWAAPGVPLARFAEQLPEIPT